jgi:hypothetical protein
MDSLIERFKSLGKNKNYLVLAGIMCAFIFLMHMKPNEIKVETNAGTLYVTRPVAIGIPGQKDTSSTEAILMVGAAGSRESSIDPWVKTGIKVQPNDSIKIEADGNVHTALKRLMNIASINRDPNPEQYQTWTGPDGYSLSTNKDWDAKRKVLRLLPDHPYGALVGAIWDGQSPISADTKMFIGRSLGSEEPFNVKKEGELVLAVNDLLLNEKAKDLYALPVENNRAYYDARLREEEDISTWADDKKEMKIQELYQKRLKAWEEIEKSSLWTVWFDDNLGAFSVSVTKTNA